MVVDWSSTSWNGQISINWMVWCLQQSSQPSTYTIGVYRNFFCTFFPMLDVAGSARRCTCWIARVLEKMSVVISKVDQKSGCIFSVYSFSAHLMAVTSPQWKESGRTEWATTKFKLKWHRLAPASVGIARQDSWWAWKGRQITQNPPIEAALDKTLNLSWGVLNSERSVKLGFCEGQPVHEFFSFYGCVLFFIFFRCFLLFFFLNLLSSL